MSLTKNRVVKLQDNETLHFLELYAKERILYDTTLGDYKDKDLRIAAATRISNELNIPGFGRRQVITKFKNLRSSYCQELKKISESERNGKDDVYLPKVFWFDLMNSFIRPFVQQRPTQSNLEILPNPSEYSHEDQSQSEILSADDDINESIPCTSLYTDDSTTEKTPKRKISPQLLETKKHKLNDPSINMKSNIEKLDNPNRSAIPNVDSYHFFGKYVASMLRSIGQPTSIILQKNITSVISKEVVPPSQTESSVNLGDSQVQRYTKPEDEDSCGPNYPIEGNLTNQKVSGKTFNLPPRQATSSKKRRLQDRYIRNGFEKLDSIKKNSETEFDIWCKSLASQINNMETVRALTLQMQIQNLVAKERIEYEMQKSRNSSDRPSTSSYANQPSVRHFNKLQQETITMNDSDCSSPDKEFHKSEQLNSIKEEIDEVEDNNEILFSDKSDDDENFYGWPSIKENN